VHRRLTCLTRRADQMRAAPLWHTGAPPPTSEGGVGRPQEVAANLIAMISEPREGGEVQAHPRLILGGDVAFSKEELHDEQDRPQARALLCGERALPRVARDEGGSQGQRAVSWASVIRHLTISAKTYPRS